MALFDSGFRSHRTRIAAAVALVLVLVGASMWSGARARPRDAAPSRRAAKVVVFGFPGLAWADLTHGQLPNLQALARRGAVGAMTVRTVSAAPSPAEGYASLGAGARVRAPGTIEASGGDVGGPLQVDGVSRLAGANRGQHLATGPGALGDALAAAGRRSAVVGDSAAALAVMDSKGRVPAAWPAPATAGAVSDAASRADVVVVAPQSGVAAADDLLGGVEATLPPDALLVVVSVAPPAQTWHLEPVVVAGPGVPHGYVDSPSTKRQGLVTLTDLAPQILTAVGAPVPSAFIGRAFRYHAGQVSEARLAGLDADGRARAATYTAVAWCLVALHALVYGAAAWVLWRGRRRRWTALRYGLLAIAAFPLATFVVRIVPPAQWHGWVPAGLVLADAALVALAAQVRSHVLAPFGALAGMTVAVLLFDMSTGARLQVNSVLGYAPLSADRFFGIGGTTLGVLVAATVLGAAVWVDRAADRRQAAVVVGALFFVVAVVAGSPLLGAKVGAILTMVPVFVLTASALAGRRPTWRLVALAVVVTGAAVAAAALVDAVQAPTARAHLGQLVDTAGASRGHALFTTIVRKAATDVRVVRETVWSWVALIVVAFLAYLLGWDRRFARILPPGSPVRTGALAALGAGVLGLFLNDTGIIITALVLLYLGPYLTLLALGAKAATAAPPAHDAAADATAPHPAVSPETPGMTEPLGTGSVLFGGSWVGVGDDH
ncbi:MAG: hypothetical protein JO265_11655 [Acidimicrobiia bacterium]|nr:hypothetical protein [Acidimicrobiia bacterium]